MFRHTNTSFLRKFSIALLFLLFIAGCSTTQVLQPVSPPSDGKALVYFLRSNYPPTLREMRIIVNGTNLATVANNDYVAVNVPTGKNSVLIEANDGKPFSFELPIEKAERIYVVLTGDVKKTGMTSSGYREYTVHLNWNLRAYSVSKAEAEDILSKFGKKLQ